MNVHFVVLIWQMCWMRTRVNSVKIWWSSDEMLPCWMFVYFHSGFHQIKMYNCGDFSIKSLLTHPSFCRMNCLTSMPGSIWVYWAVSVSSSFILQISVRIRRYVIVWLYEMFCSLWPPADLQMQGYFCGPPGSGVVFVCLFYWWSSL